MTQRYVMVVMLAGLALAVAGCTQKAADDATRATGEAAAKAKASSDVALHAAKDGAAEAIEATKKGAETAIDETVKASARAGAAVATTGEAITDAWITAKLKAKFVDETLLENSHITVVNDDHVVTLTGTVMSTPARDRAVVIATGTEGVARVVNRLVVR